MSLAQASIRQLYEQIHVLEAEAVRPARRRRFPYVLVLLAAAAAGAATAGLSHSSAHGAPARAGTAPRARASVVHLIDAPAERRRALPAVAAKRTQVVRLVAVRVARPVVHVTVPAAPPVAHVAAPPAAPAAHAVAAPHVSPVGIVVHRRALPARRRPQPRRQPRPAAVPVGIGPVAVTTSDEPLPDPAAGATPTTTP